MTNCFKKIKIDFLVNDNIVPLDAKSNVISIPNHEYKIRVCNENNSKALVCFWMNENKDSVKTKIINKQSSVTLSNIDLQKEFNQENKDEIIWLDIATKHNKSSIYTEQLKNQDENEIKVVFNPKIGKMCIRHSYVVKINSKNICDVEKIDNQNDFLEENKDSNTGQVDLESTSIIKFATTKFGEIYHGDSALLLDKYLKKESVDLIMTSPPFGLIRKKMYGNANSDEYLDWFRPFASSFKKVLKPTGSLVIDIGGSWVSGQPTRSLYHYELLIMLCKEFGFHLAQDFFWWNPAKLPTPAEWVTIRRIRVKDAINCIWWLSPTPWPKASNRRVLTPYSDSMRDLLKNGYVAKKRPSGHEISDKFSNNNGASIPPNLLPFPNTDSNSHYLRYCKENGFTQHPARYPAELPEYFIRMLTNKNDVVLDPFAGSCITGEVSERLERKWICCEIIDEYLKGAVGRFNKSDENKNLKNTHKSSYSVSNSAFLWNGIEDEPLPDDGGKVRPKKK